MNDRQAHPTAGQAKAGPGSPENPVRRRTGGRSARVRAAVLEAVIAALAETELEDVTMAEIARRAGVHQSSIQRRWGTVNSVLLDALLDYSEDLIPVPDTGTLRGDLIELSRFLVDYLSTPQGMALTRAMATVQDDASLAHDRAQFWRSRRRAVGAVFERATERGELATGADTDSALELLAARVHFRCLLTREPNDDHSVEQTIDFILRGLAAR